MIFKRGKFYWYEFEFQGQRDALNKWAVAQGAEGLVDYRAKKNARSIDGLPAFSG